MLRPFDFLTVSPENKGSLADDFEQMKTKNRNPENGMTLVEVVIASCLLAFVVLGSVSALSAGFGYILHARMTTLSTQITQSAMEQMRLSNYSSIIAYAAQRQPVSFDSIVSADNFSSGFTTSVQVSANFTTLVTSATGVLGETRVAITTTWTENGVGYSAKTTTLFTEKGLSDYIYAGWAP
jgi:Tfp pilus assembly protein PilV